jgi:hypothetical protein
MIHTSYYQNPRLIAAQKAGTVAVVQTSNSPPRFARPGAGPGRVREAARKQQLENTFTA